MMAAASASSCELRANVPDKINSEMRHLKQRDE
jgi:hypothetical protein